MWTGVLLSFSELLRYCQSLATVRVTVRVVVRAQPLSDLLSDLLSEVLSEQLPKLSRYQKIRTQKLNCHQSTAKVVGNV